MSKDVKEKANEWGCSPSTVRKYCSSGIIPPADQVGHRKTWFIPDEWPKPPMTRRVLCFLLDTLYQINHGVQFDAIMWGYSMDEVKAGFNYLIGCAFMSTTTKSQDLEKILKHAGVTSRGEELITRENTESKGKVNFRAHVTIKANVGVASVEVGAEVSNG